MGNESTKGPSTEREQTPERSVDALPGETVFDVLKRISQTPRVEGESKFVDIRGGLGPISIVPFDLPSGQPDAPVVRELDEDEGFNLMWGQYLEREAQEQREAQAPAVREPSEEDKVKELFEAYQRSGEAGIREILRRRNEEYVRQQQGKQD